MNKKRVLIVLTLVVFAVVGLISCNSEISDSMNLADVSFAPSVSKALNQSGSTIMYSVNIQDYHWKYYCNNLSGTPADSDWKDFPDAETGLGTIKNLYRGDNYYFGLRGYTTGTSYTDDDLVWEGFHYGADGKTPEKVTLKAKNQLVSIDVYTKGNGNLFFSVGAPNESPFNIQSGTNWVKEGFMPDRFYYVYQSLDGKTSGSDYLTATEYSTETGYWSYIDSPDTPAKKLPAGTYLFTIQQQTWDYEKPVVGSMDVGDYIDVVDRAQILIVNIVSGVDTVLSGTLDSKGIVPFEYYAYSEVAGEHGFDIFYHSKLADVSPLSVIAEDEEGEQKLVHNYDRLKVVDGGFTQIYTSVADTKHLKLFVNGEELTTKTEEGWYITCEDSSTLVKPGDDKGSGFESIKCYGQAGLSYLITVVYDDMSMTYTITSDVIQNKSTAGGVLVAGLDNFNLYTNPGDAIHVFATVTNYSGTQLLNQFAGDHRTSTSDDYLTLYLTIVEDENVRTPKQKVYEIDMAADVVIKENNVVVFSTTTNVTEVADYVTALFKVPDDVENLVVKHSGVTMTNWTSTGDIEDATAEYDNGYGFYTFSKTERVLYLKTKTFSPFRISYTIPDKYALNYYVPNSVRPIYTEYISKGYLAKNPWQTATIGGEAKLVKTWYKDKEKTQAWNFQKDTVETDTNLYGEYVKNDLVSTQVFFHESVNSWKAYKVSIDSENWNDLVENQYKNNLCQGKHGYFYVDWDGYVYLVSGSKKTPLYDYSSKEKDKTTQVKGTDPVVASSGVYGYYVRETFKLSFNVNFTSSTETFNDITVLDGIPIGTLPAPQDPWKEVNFDGWFYTTSADSNDRVISTTEANVFKSHILYGHWVTLRVTLKNRKLEIIDTFYVNYGDKIGTRLKMDYQEAGWIFICWLNEKSEHGWIGNWEETWDQDTRVYEDTTLYQYWVGYGTGYMRYTNNSGRFKFQTKEELENNTEYTKFSQYDIFTDGGVIVDGCIKGASYWIEYKTDTNNKVHPVLANNCQAEKDWLWITLPEGKEFYCVTLNEAHQFLYNLYTGESTLEFLERRIVITSSTDYAHRVLNPYEDMILEAHWALHVTIEQKIYDSEITTPTSLTPTNLVIRSGYPRGQLNAYKSQSKAGYVFDGWYKDGSSSTVVTSYDENWDFWTLREFLTEDFTLSSRFRKYRTVTFQPRHDCGDYDSAYMEGYGPTTVTYFVGVGMTLPRAIKEEYLGMSYDTYYSTGWKEVGGSGTVMTSISTAADKDYVLYPAGWSK